MTESSAIQQAAGLSEVSLVARMVVRYPGGEHAVREVTWCQPDARPVALVDPWGRVWRPELRS